MLWQLENQAEWCQFCPSFLYSLWNRLWKSEGVGLSSQETVSHSNKCVCCKVAQRGRNRELHHLHRISHICALSNKCCVLVCLCVCVSVCMCVWLCLCRCMCVSVCLWVLVCVFCDFFFFLALVQTPRTAPSSVSTQSLLCCPYLLSSCIIPSLFSLLISFPSCSSLSPWFLFFILSLLFFLLFLLSTFLLLLFCFPPHLLFISLSSSSFVWFCDHFFFPSLISLYLSSPLHSFIFSFLPSPLLLPLYITYCCWLGLKWSIALWEVGGGGLW